MARYTKTDVTTGDVVQSDINVQLGLIETAIADTLSRKGDVPNTMESDLDLNSNDILNVASLGATAITLNGVPISTVVGTVDVAANYAWTGTHTWTTNPVDVTDGYAWTGIHSFATKLLPSDLNLTSTYTWTGSHTFNGSISGIDVGDLTEVAADTPVNLDVITFDGADWVLADVNTLVDTSAVARTVRVETTAPTLVAGDLGNVVVYNSGSNANVTIPTGLGAGFWCTVIQQSSGNITYVASGTTLVGEVAMNTIGQKREIDAITDSIISIGRN